VFHVTAEMFSIAVAWAVFMLVWNARRYINNDALLLLGSAYLFIGFIDLVHIMTAFGSMGLFQDSWRVSLPANLWIAGRYMEASALFLFATFLGRSFRPFLGLILWAFLAGLLLVMIFSWRIFPDSILEGIEHIPFRIGSKYAITLALLATLVLLHRKRKVLDAQVYRLIAASILATMAAELTVAFSIAAYDFSNVAGHYLKVISYMFIYMALIYSGLTRPYDLLFRKLAAEKAELEQTKLRLDLIFDTVPVLIWQKDQEGVYLQVNKVFCDTAGLGRDDILGKKDHQIFPPKIAEKYISDDREVLRSGRDKIGMEEQYVSASGTRGWSRTDKMILRDVDGKVAGTIGFAKDITQQKHAQAREKAHQEQLVQAAKMTALGTLVAGVAHEVNNPNNFIILNTPLLEEAWADSLPILEAHHAGHPEFKLAGMPYARMRDNVAKLFSGIHQGSKRIKQIVAELKSFARQAPLDMNRKVQLNQVVDAALTMLRKTIAEHTDRFEVRLAPDLPLVRGDFQKLEQVVVNLLINACQALPDKNRRIVLETYTDLSEESVVLRITDEGQGIAPENIERIRDPFYSTRHDIGGTGLGLSISSSIIQSHKGRMTFDSAPGLGTTVTILLKAAT